VAGGVHLPDRLGAAEHGGIAADGPVQRNAGIGVDVDDLVPQTGQFGPLQEVSSTRTTAASATWIGSSSTWNVRVSLWRVRSLDYVNHQPKAHTEAGGPRGTRTHNPRIKRAVLTATLASSRPRDLRRGPLPNTRSSPVNRRSRHE
jgi:hypothetical protein